MGDVLLDLRYSVRKLYERPGFSAVVILTLALGVAANTSILSVANTVYTRPLPFPEPDRLYMVFDHYPKGGLPRLNASYPDYRDWREHNEVFEHLAAAASYLTVTLMGREEPHQLRANLVDSDFFPMLAAQPHLGRTFRPEEDRAPLGDPVAILSYALWQRHFGGDPAIVGQQIRLSDTAYTVVGVMPPDFHDPIMQSIGFRTDIWLPLTRWSLYQETAPGTRSVLEARMVRFLLVLGRLKPGVTFQQAGAQMMEVARRIEAEFPATNRDTGVILVPLRELYFENVDEAVLLLVAGAALLLLIVCANVANLFTVRALARRREISIRMALGATRRVIARQLLMEGLALALAGGLLGILLAALSLESLLRLSPIQLPAFSAVRVDLPVFLVSLLLSVLASLLFSVLPALQGIRVALRENLVAARGSAAGSGSLLARKVLIVAEIALTVVLLVAAGLLARTLSNLQVADPGFDPANRLTFAVDLRGQRYATPELRAAFARQVVEHLGAVPGVETADVWQPDPPGQNVLFTAVVKEGETADPALARVIVRYKAVSPGALTHAGVPILRGREISEADGPGVDAVAVISQSLAGHLWPGEEAVGKRFRRTSRPEWYTVIGVAADVKHQGQLFPDSNPRDTYYSFQQYTRPNIHLVVKTAGDPAALASSMRRAIRDLDPSLAVHQVSTLEEIVANEAKPARFASLLSGFFALLALALASLGIYGLLAYSVSQRSGEFGIRLALGAEPGHIFGIVLREGARLAVIGSALGVAASVSLSRWLTSMLFGISPVDPVTYAAILAALATLVLLACYVPARRATRVDPVIALRAE